MTPRENAAYGAALGLISGFVARDLDLLTLVSFWGDRQILLPLGLVLGALCGTTRFRKPLVVLTLFLGALWIAVAYGPVSRMLVAGLVRTDPLRPADAVLVLASNIQKDGDPTSTQLARLYRGLEVVKDGLAPRLMVSELPPPYAHQKPWAQAMVTRFRPDAELVVLGPVRNTHDEAVAAADYLKSLGLKRIIVVSSPTHMFRAAALLEAQGLEVMASPAIETRFDLQNLDRTDDRLIAFGSAIHEQVGLVVYRYRGWIR